METVIKKIRDEIYDEFINTNSIFLDKTNNLSLLVLMFDYYNFLHILKEKNNLNDCDKAFLAIVDSATFEEIFNLFTSDFYFTLQSIYSNYSFNQLTTIEKQNFMYQLHFTTESNALTNHPLYKLDMLSYFPSGKLEDLTKNFKEYLDNYNENFDIIEKVIYNLDILHELDDNKYKNILLEIIYEYYKLDKSRLHQSKKIEIKNRLYHCLIKILSDDKIIKYSTSNKKKYSEILGLYFVSKTILTNQEYQERISSIESKIPKKLIKKFNNKKEI